MLSRILLGFMLVGTLGAGFANAQQVEASNPSYEGIEVRMVKDNLITRSLSVEGLRLHVYGGELIVWDDNLYNDADDEVEDHAWLSVLGTEATYVNNLLEFNLSARLRDFNYDDVDENDYTDHSVKGDVEFDISEMLDVRVAASTADRETQVDPALGGNDIESTTDTFGAGISVTPDVRYGVDLDWNYMEKTYDTAGFSAQDYEQTGLVMKPYYNLSANTRLSMKLMYGYTDVEEEAVRDAADDIYEAQVGVLHRFTEKVSVNAFAGYMDRDYDDLANPNDEDYDDFVGSAALVYTPSELLSTSLSVAHTAKEATSYHYYEMTRTSLSGTYMPMEALKLNASLSYDGIEPSDDSIEDSDVLTGRLAVTYALNEFFTFGGSYKYTDKESDDDALEYDRQLLSVGAWLTF